VSRFCPFSRLKLQRLAVSRRAALTGRGHPTPGRCLPRLPATERGVFLRRRATKARRLHGANAGYLSARPLPQCIPPRLRLREHLLAVRRVVRAAPRPLAIRIGLVPLPVPIPVAALLIANRRRARLR
jgi:hypothetical protein